MNTDVVMAISDRATDALSLLFNSDTGRGYLHDRRGVPASIVDALQSFGLSSICNVLAAIKTARYFDLGEDDLVLTVATDGAELYETEWAKVERTRFGGRLDPVSAGEVFAEHLLGASTDHVLELSARDRARVFNLGYYTWVEQQGVSIQEFTARRDQRFWTGLRSHLSVWDDLIREFNRRTAAAS
jgi:cysteine synthase A